MKKPRNPKPTLPPFVVLKGPKGTPPGEKEWHVRISVRTGRKDPKGRIVYTQFTRRCEPKTPQRAAEIVAFLKGDIARKTADLPPSGTVGGLLSDYLAVKKDSVSARTLDYYRFFYDAYIKDKDFGSADLSDLKTKQVQEFYKDLRSRGVSPGNVRRLHVFLKMAFKQGVIWEDIPKNPCVGIIVPRPKSAETNYFREAEAKRFVAECRKTCDNIVFELDLETGLRPQEVLALSWADVDFGARRIAVTKALVARLNGEGVEVGDLKTEESRRSVSFSESMKERLLAQKRNLDARAAELRKELKNPAAGGARKTHAPKRGRRSVRRRVAKDTLKNLETHNLVFPAANGKPFSIRNVNKRKFKPLVRAAGLDAAAYSFKSLRHTFAYLMAERIGPKRLQKLMGHSDIKTTLEYYVHVDEDSQSEANDQMRDILY